MPGRGLVRRCAVSGDLLEEVLFKTFAVGFVGGMVVGAVVAFAIAWFA